MASGTMTNVMDAVRASRSTCAYLWAKKFVISSGFEDEIKWQRQVQCRAFDEVDFLRESAWVVLSAGMKEAVVRKCFPALSQAFHNWSSSSSIAKSQDACVASALSVFNHRRKISAIAAIAVRCNLIGFSEIKSQILNSGVHFLQSLPYIGPITCFHLAKNLGIDTAKPDRHLQRIAHVSGYDSVDTLCSELSAIVGDEIAVIDVVLWRFATLHKRYLEVFQEPSRIIDSRPHMRGNIVSAIC